MVQITIFLLQQILSKGLLQFNLAELALGFICANQLINFMTIFKNYNGNNDVHAIFFSKLLKLALDTNVTELVEKILIAAINLYLCGANVKDSTNFLQKQVVDLSSCLRRKSARERPETMERLCRKLIEKFDQLFAEKKLVEMCYADLFHLHVCMVTFGQK